MGAVRPPLQTGNVVSDQDSSRIVATRLLCILCIEDDRDWAVVLDLDSHSRPKLAPGHANTLGLESIAKGVVQRPGHFGPGGGREAGPISAGRVGDESELTDRQHSAADLVDVAVETAPVVLEDPKTGDFSSQPGRRFAVVVLGDTD